MVVLEQYLQLYEKESQLVSSAWKTLHIFFYVVIALSGIAASSAFSQVLESFGGNCVLHSNVTFVSGKADNSTSHLTIDCVKTEWGRQTDCSFCQYVPVCSVIFSIVWITFFLMCGRGGKTTRGLSQPWRIVLPSLIFNIIFLGLALAAACKLQDGINVFCNFFQDDMDETNCHDLARYQLMEGNTGLMTYRYMKAAQISAWINVAGWSMSVIVLLIRCFCAPDFQLIEISILAPTPVQEQVWSAVIVTEILLLVMAVDWVQLPMVEPGGRIQFNSRPRDNENDFQIQTPEANRRTDETQMKVKTMNPINKFPPAETSDIFTDQFTIKRTTKYIENDQSDAQEHNSELNLNKNDPVITSSVPKSHNSKLDTYDSVENNYGAQMPEEKVTFIQPFHKLPFKSDLETKESHTQIPQLKVHSTTLNLNTPNFPPRPDLEVTTMQVDVKLPNPMTVKHHSDIKDSASTFSNTFYETNTTPYAAVKADNENPEGIITSTEPDVSDTEDESEGSWTSGTVTSNNKTEENIPQDVRSPLDMLRAVHRTLIQETPHTVRGKMHFLQQLKNKMLLYIEGHIKGLWTSDHERQARTEKGMAFPSMEGALMSISFLIFAVFLIKLVQQLIQNLQGTNMAMTTGRHSRSLPDLLTTARVLRLVDEFPFQHEDNGWSDRQHASPNSGR